VDRQKYLEALRNQLERNIFYHSLALEACMAGLYDYFKTNDLLSPAESSKEDWLLAGLIHDIDYSGEYKTSHPLKAKEVLAEYGLDLPESVDKIIKAHAPDLTGYQPQNKAQWSIFCADSLTGLIVATTLVYSSKKLADVKLSSVLKRFKEHKFAAGTRRQDILMCEKPEGLNMKLEKFIEICFNSMQSIAKEIAL
jgi:predicted hydrolase (HD superfamily)